MRKKILFASSKESIFTQPVAANLKKLGFFVDYFDLSDDFLNNKYFRKLLNQLPVRFKNKINGQFQNKINRNLYTRSEKNKIDYLLVIKGKNIKPKTVRQISAQGIKTINWFPDAMTNWGSIELLASSYNFFFTYDPYILKKLKEEKGLNNCYYLPFAANLDKNASLPNKKDYQYDISFLGSYEPGLYDARVDYLNRLADLDLHIWGNKNWLKTPLAKFYHGWVKDEEIMQIYSRSKIVVNIDQQIPEEKGLNLRPFEATAAGSFLLNDPIKDDIFRLFEDGKEVVVFKDAEDLRNKVRYYLDHEEEREKIARAGFERTKKEHIYQDRLKQMFEIVDSN